MNDTPNTKIVKHTLGDIKIRDCEARGDYPAHREYIIAYERGNAKGEIAIQQWSRSWSVTATTSYGPKNIRLKVVKGLKPDGPYLSQQIEVAVANAKSKLRSYWWHVDYPNDCDDCDIYGYDDDMGYGPGQYDGLE